MGARGANRRGARLRVCWWDRPTRAFEGEGAKAASATVRVDAKGRLSLPRRLREARGIEPGDTLFVEGGEGQATLHLAKAENPFDVLADHAIREDRAGRTKSRRDFARENDLDDE